MIALHTILASAGLSLALLAHPAAAALAQAPGATAPAEPAPAPIIDFGDDSSEWANDGECDDPRFEGPAAAAELLEIDRGHDATDCRTAFGAGRVTLVDPAAAGAADEGRTARIDFGDDSGDWAHDGECDDPDFFGAGMAAKLLPAGRMRDASDCRAAFVQGTIALGEASVRPAFTFDYGSDSSLYAHDGECDDPRFEGPGTDKKLLREDLRADASDCRALETEGKVSIRPVYGPDYAAGAPYDGSAIDFGDDSSTYANDGECDDPRFEGPGTASTLLEGDIAHDAADCRAAFTAGTVVLLETGAR